jgi:hypothetical protein
MMPNRPGRPGEPSIPHASATELAAEQTARERLAGNIPTMICTQCSAGAEMNEAMENSRHHSGPNYWEVEFVCPECDGIGFVGMDSNGNVGTADNCREKHDEE